MITLYRKKAEPLADEIQEKLEEMVLAFRVKMLPEHSEKNLFIEDGSGKVEDPDEIESWLNKLEQELSWQRSITGDGCYLDPDTGAVC